MAAAPPPPPELIDDVTDEILLRLPPDEPEHLFRAALVCKPWLRILCDPAFLRRYRASHGAPPLLGFIIHRLVLDAFPRLSSTTAVPVFTHPGPDGPRLPPRPRPHAGGRSSETCTWSTPVSLDDSRFCDVLPRRGALVNDEVYFTSSRDYSILKYDWGNNWLSTVKTPVPQSRYYGWATVMTTVDGSLGLAGVEGSSLYLWSRRKVNSDGDADWVLSRVIELETVRPMANLRDGANVVGFVDGAYVIFLNTNAGLFTIELKSGRARMVDESRHHFSILPYMSFYTPDRGTLLSLARSRGLSNLQCAARQQYIAKSTKPSS